MKKSFINKALWKTLGLGFLLLVAIENFARAKLISQDSNIPKAAEPSSRVPPPIPPSRPLPPPSGSRDQQSAVAHTSSSLDTHIQRGEKTEQSTLSDVQASKEAEERAVAAERLVAQEAKELEEMKAQLAQQQQLLKQQQEEATAKEAQIQQRQMELEQRLNALAAQQGSSIQLQQQLQPEPQFQSQQSAPPRLPAPPPQERMGINGFLGTVFGQRVEDTLNGPGRSLEHLVSSAVGRRGENAQRQAFDALGGLFSTLFRR